MKTANIIKITFVSALLGTTAVGCSTTGKVAAVSSATAPDSNARTAANLAAKASAKLDRKAFAEAIGYAEGAVAADPRNAEYRSLLGRAYLAAGRFASAAQSYQDVVDLGGGNGRVSLNLALAQIAQGNREGALAALEDARLAVPAADYGLGLALAGNVDQAIEVLERAARSEGAGPRERQNLALSYAMAGRWADSRTIAGQDVSADELKTRMEQWSVFVRPSTNADQVASLLHITPHDDPGQPTQLALANFPDTALAQTTAPAVEAFAPAPVTENQFATVAEPAASGESEPYYASNEIGPVDSSPVKQKVAAEQSVVAAASPASYTPSSAAIGKGKYVVQIGAFAKRGNAEIAWNRAVARNSALAEATTLIATAPHRKLYRLSAGGFETRRAAEAVCGLIKRSGGTCFVRSTAGDAPMQWAFKGKSKAKTTQVASR